MESTTEQALQIVFTDAIHQLEGHDYIVVPTNDPNDIYRRLEGLGDAVLWLRTNRARSGWNHGSAPQVFTSNKGVGNLPTQKVGLVVPHDVRLTPYGKAKDYQIDYELRLGDVRIMVRVADYNPDGVTFTEQGGTFYHSVLGCVVPLLDVFQYSYINKGDLYHVLWTLRHDRPVVFSDNTQRLRFVQRYAPKLGKLPIGKTEGITKTLAAVMPLYEAESNPLNREVFRIMAEGSRKTIKSVKFSKAFNQLFEKATTQESFSALLDSAAELLFHKERTHKSDFTEFLENVMNTLEGARDMQKAALQKKSTGAFNKIMDDLDFVKIDEARFPKTHDAVMSGTIPLGTFFRKNGDSYFMYNDNWALWEEMLTRHPEEAVAISAEASKRTTYEKDIMSYFYFLMYGLPEYLEKHTGKKWTSSPRLVKSSNELEPPKEGSNGVAKTRSALTPIVDNEKSHVVIPYVSMVVSGGYGNTYTYGLDFNVLHRGFTYKGNTVTNDVEKALNGRDDYGLMFYTLTGSSNGTGYPTFLIIFERLEDSTKVHFHRTHPFRSKDGEENPVHNWTIGCYKWMIGNVNFERIKAQQGDLAFVEIDEMPKGEPELVNGYDSHMFDAKVPYLPYTKKDRQNVLGYIQLDQDTVLNHTEHMNRVIPKGIYEIRQCRSWEANPKGVWSLRID